MDHILYDDEHNDDFAQVAIVGHQIIPSDPRLFLNACDHDGCSLEYRRNGETDDEVNPTIPCE